VLIIEPDTAGRHIMDRVLAAEGHSVDAVSSAAEARVHLARGTPVDLILVDELGDHGQALDDVRHLRRELPSVPVIVMGTLLSTHVLEELLRLGVVDALRKPFTPTELRESVAHALLRTSKRHEEALDFAAAVEIARRSLATQQATDTAMALRRAQAISPLDAEVMALNALVAELDGRDADADRAYRAALALRDNEDTPPPDPHEGLARLAAYGAARPAPALGPARAEQPLWLVTDPGTELLLPSPAGESPCVVVMALGLGREGGAFFREAPTPNHRAFALLSGSTRVEPLAQALRALGSGPLVTVEPTTSAIDIERVTQQRQSSPPAKKREERNGHDPVTSNLASPRRPT
jgi:DNA-binding response OmpR family regulator